MFAPNMRIDDYKKLLLQAHNQTCVKLPILVASIVCIAPGKAVPKKTSAG
jgi:hypothetical protein